MANKISDKDLVERIAELQQQIAVLEKRFNEISAPILADLEPLRLLHAEYVLKQKRRGAGKQSGRKRAGINQARNRRIQAAYDADKSLLYSKTDPLVVRLANENQLSPRQIHKILGSRGKP